MGGNTSDTEKIAHLTSSTFWGTFRGGERGVRPSKEDLRRTSLRLVISATAPVKSQPVTHGLAEEACWYCILPISTLNASQKERAKE